MVVKNLKRIADGSKDSSGEGSGKRSKAENDIFEILRGGEVKKEKKCYVIRANRTSDYTVPHDAPVVTTTTTDESTTIEQTVGGDSR